jgi:hypothetical protein
MFSLNIHPVCNAHILYSGIHRLYAFICKNTGLFMLYLINVLLLRTLYSATFVHNISHTHFIIIICQKSPTGIVLDKYFNQKPIHYFQALNPTRRKVNCLPLKLKNAIQVIVYTGQYLCHSIGFDRCITYCRALVSNTYQ